MKFPRTAKILRSQFDMAPFAAVFFCLVIFMMLATKLPVPGLPMGLQPPSASDLPGIGGPSIALAVDSQNRLFFENQMVTEPELRTALALASQSSPTPLTLIIHADQKVTYAQLAHLALLARTPGIGITNLLLATLPVSQAAAGQP